MSLSYIWAVNVPPVSPVQLQCSLKKKKNLLKFQGPGTTVKVLSVTSSVLLNGLWLCELYWLKSVEIRSVWCWFHGLLSLFFWNKDWMSCRCISCPQVAALCLLGKICLLSLAYFFRHSVTVPCHHLIVRTPAAYLYMHHCDRDGLIEHKAIKTGTTS